jgi:hypothetical protein
MLGPVSSRLSSCDIKEEGGSPYESARRSHSLSSRSLVRVRLSSHGRISPIVPRLNFEHQVAPGSETAQNPEDKTPPVATL